MENAFNAGTEAATRGKHFAVHAPFIQKKKSEIIRLGLELGADFSYSISCYAGAEIPCMKCSSCLLRQRAWQEAGTEDHLIVRLKKEGRI
jgi:7-cyano-7-deazaguanine synthase